VIFGRKTTAEDAENAEEERVGDEGEALNGLV
jgi:hypothetical protein